MAYNFKLRRWVLEHNSKAIDICSSEAVPSEVYTPLENPSSFRVLHVLPADSPEESIRCHLWDASEMDLSPERYPGYIALSYVWGDFTRRETITVNGHAVEIRGNLADALRELRAQYCRPEFAQYPFLLWVDALCINQADDAEKSIQVRQMARIYDQAWDVLVWLGTATPGTAETFDMIVDLERTWGAAGLDEYDVVGHLQRLQDKGREPFRLLAELVGNLWFTRVWTIQEAGLTGRVILVWGPHRMDFAKFQPLLTGQFSRATYPNMVKFERQEDEKYRKAVCDDLRKIGLGYIQVGIPWSPEQFPDLLQHVRPYQCTDNRDRIYGVLGLVENEAPGLLVDYSKSMVEVYIDAVEYCIETAQDLTILSYAQTKTLSKTDLQAPSWCPNWAIRDSEHLQKLCVGRKVLGGNATLYSATGNRTPKATFRADTGVMSIEGFRVSTISWSSILLDFVYEHVKVPHNSLVQQLCQALNMESLPEHLHAVLWSTVVVDQWVRITPQGASYYRISKDGLEGFPPRNDAEQEHLLVQRSTMGRQWAASNRRLLVTNSPPFFALGPWNTQEGDIIAALFGGDCLYVLGEIEGYTRFIGECYVHEMMDGQLIDALEREDFRTEVFELH